MSNPETRSRGVSIVAILGALLLVPATAFAGTVLKLGYGPALVGTTAEYGYPNQAIGDWAGAQAPTSAPGYASPLSTTGTTGKTLRLFRQTNPGTSPAETSPTVLHAEVRQGDVTVTDGVTRPRSEVFSNAGLAVAGTSPTAVTRWYSFALRVGSAFKTDPTGANWVKLTQWKGNAGTTPPLALQAANGKLELQRKPGTTGTSNCTSTCWPKLGPLPTTGWTRLQIGVVWSINADGLICVLRDGQALPAGFDGDPGTTPSSPAAADNNQACLTGIQTLQTKAPGVPDSIYVKQGIYQSEAWNTTPSQDHTVLFGPLTIGETLSDVSP